MSASASAKSRMERILRLQEQIDEIKLDIRQVYAEEKADGGDKTAMGAAISYIRKREKDSNALAEREALADVYLAAFDAPRAHTHTREGTGEITEHEQPETATKSLANGPCDAATERPAMLVAPVTGAAVDGVSGQPEVIPSLTGQFPGANVSGLIRAGVTAGETATYSNPQPSTLSGADKPEAVSPPAVSGVLSDDDVPAFLKKDQPRKTAKDYRPHCLHPEACGSSGLHHCYTCQKAIDATAESEAA